MTRHTSLFTLIITCISLIKGVDCSECSRSAEIYGIQAISLCQSTASRTTATGIVFDFYYGNYAIANTCTCSISIQATSNFTLSMTPYQGLGINSNSGCGSKIRVNSTRSGQLTMECSVLGILDVIAGDNITLKLTLEPDGDSRYCMLMTANPYTISADCHAIESPTTTTTTSTASTINPSTTTMEPTRSTTPEPTTTPPPTTTTTMKPTTTSPPTTMKSTTTTRTTTMKLTTTTPTTTKLTTTTKTTIMVKTTSMTSSTPPFTGTESTMVPTSTSVKETSEQQTFTSNPTTNIQTTLSVTNTTTSTTPSQTMSSNPTSYTGTTGQPTSSSTKAGGGPIPGEQRPGGPSDDNLIIIIPVVLGVFVIFLLVVVVAHFVRARHKGDQPGPETDTYKFGRNLTNDGVFHYQSEMVEHTNYDDTDDLHGHSDHYSRVTNPVYIHEDENDDDYVPDITDQEVAHFTAMHNTESEKITSFEFQNGEEVGNEAPLYAVVNKPKKQSSLDDSKYSDVNSRSSGDTNSNTAFQENGRNQLKEEDGFFY